MLTTALVGLSFGLSFGDLNTAPDEITLDFERFWITENWKTQAPVPAPTQVNIKGKRALRFPCSFHNTDFPRAVWDLVLTEDWADIRGIEVLFYAPKTSPIPPITAYFRSGNAWYSVDLFATAAPAEDSGWFRLRVLKSLTANEGKPEGWRRIDRFRLAAWRNGDSDTEFFLSEPRILKSSSPIMLLRGESVAHNAPEASRVAFEQTGRIELLYNQLGISPKVVSDLDITNDLLQNIRLIVLPNNPTMPENALSQLRRFADREGKIIAFRDIPESIAQTLHVRRGHVCVAQYPGQFYEVRKSNATVPGLPESCLHTSWAELRQSTPLTTAQTIAVWYDREGKPLGVPAVILSEKGAYLNHVLTYEQPAAKRALLLALTAYILPEQLSASMSWRLQQPAERFQGRMSDTEASEWTRRANKLPGTSGKLKQAIQERKSAQEAFNRGELWKAHALLEKADADLLEAWGRVQETIYPEWRAFWCHNPSGAGGMGWEETIRRLAENGFNAVLANMAWAGATEYPRRILPASSGNTRNTDQLAECLAACKKYKIALHVWKICWNMGTKTSKSFRDQMARENRLQVRRDGKILDSWLCPSHPANRQLEVDSVSEIASQYDVTGIHLDYIRYESSNTCFCDGCRRRFEQYLGKPVPNWPATVDPDGQWRTQWLEFRRNTITETVREMRNTIRSLNPKLALSAAVFPDWKKDRDQVGQDWKIWCDKGYLDFVCPMTYVSFTPLYHSAVAMQKQWAGKIPCYPGIGLSVWVNPEDTIRLNQQIQVTRNLKMGGFTVFDLKESVARDILPLCGMGLTRTTPNITD